MNKSKLLTIVIPAMYEEASIIKTLQVLDKRVKVPHKIIVVNDSYKDDKTSQLVKDYAKLHSHVSVTTKRNGCKTFASAVMQGISAVKEGYIVLVMADLCDDPGTINIMYEKILQGWDIVCGSRYTKGGNKTGGPAMQSFFSWLVCKTMYKFLRIPTTDISNAFKMYRREIFRFIKIPRNYGVEVSMYITLQAYFNGAKITDLPTKWQGRLVGKSKFKLLQRVPKYTNIYLWTIIKSINKIFSSIFQTGLLIWNKLKSKFYQYYPSSVIVLLSIVVLISLGKLINVYFWVDDWDLMLRVQNPTLRLWGMAPGLFGSGLYRYIHTPFMILYPYLGLNAGAYFGISVIIYLITTILVFVMVNVLTKKRSLAIGSAFLYGSLGYVSSYTMFHISNSYQNHIALILITITIIILGYYYKTRKSLYYWAGLFIFYLTLQFGILRSHGALFVITTLAILFDDWKFNIKNFAINIARIAPFALIYFYMYKGVFYSIESPMLEEPFNLLIRNHLFGYFVNPFGTFSNIFIPNIITKKIFQLIIRFIQSPPLLSLLLLFPLLILAIWLIKRSKELFYSSSIYLGLTFFSFLFYLFNIWAFKQDYLSQQQVHIQFITMLGFVILTALLMTVYYQWDKNNQTARIILFGIVLIFAHYIGYFFAIPSTSLLVSTDRYLTPSVVGVAMVMAGLFSLTKFSKYNLYLILTTTYCLFFIVLINKEITEVIKIISKPTKQFYKSVQQQIISLPQNPVIMMSFENDPNLKYMIRSSFPRTALAVYYGLNNRTNLIQSYDELIKIIDKEPSYFNKFYTFYVSNDGVQHTTDSVRSLLISPYEKKIILKDKWISNLVNNSIEGDETKTMILQRSNDTIGINPSIEARIDYPSLVPVRLVLSLTVSPIDLTNYKLPFYDVTKIVSRLNEKDLEFFTVNKNSFSDKACVNRINFLNLEYEHREFIHYADIETTSAREFSEAKYLSDGLIDTNWAAHDLIWKRKKKEEVILNLRTQRQFKNLAWINYFAEQTPINYYLSVSSNGEVWKRIASFNRNRPLNNQTLMVDSFNPQIAQYIKMTITKTFTSKPPALSEIWVSNLENIDASSYDKDVFKTPFICPAFSLSEIQNIYNILSLGMRASVSWKTNADILFAEANRQDIILIPDGKIHDYELFIPAQGTKLESILIDSFEMPVKVRFENASVQSMTLDEIRQSDYIRNYVIN